MPVEKFEAKEMSEGSGSRVRRALPSGPGGPLDPFVLLDEFFIPPEGGFPEHPHRGFEIVTYVLDGGIEHRDSAGGSERLGPGEVQRITAGSGVRHSELPFKEEESHGLQLWINLPKKEKGIPPSYQFVASGELPRRELEGGGRCVEVVGGESPVELNRAVDDRFCEFEGDSVYRWETPPGWRGILYVLDGSIRVDGVEAGPGEFLTVGGDLEGSVEEVNVGSGTVLADIAGEAIGEEPLLRGPYVD